MKEGVSAPRVEDIMPVSARFFGKKAILNLLGLRLPLLPGLNSIPHLISGMGTERFGLLTIVWAVIGYFSLFDLGN